MPDTTAAPGDTGAPGAPPRNRRIDRVLAADFLAGLAGASLAEVRAMRADAEQEEADVSYVRRLLQGRIDLVRAEQERRAGGEGAPSLVDSLPAILADERGPARGLGRHAAVEPSRVAEHRRRVEALVADAGLSDVGARSDAELADALATLEAEEREVSATRRRLQQVMDACTAEVTRRYRDGEADVDALLADAGVDPAGPETTSGS